MKIIFKYLLSLVFCLLIAGSVFAVNYPVPTGFVNDYANLFSDDFKIQLENRLSAFKDRTTAEIAVVTVNSLEGEPIEDYAVRLFEKWKIGNKYADNGLLLLIAKDDRAVRIEVGYGQEDYINDGRAGEIIRNEIIPEFKNGNYEAGTQKAVDRISGYIGSKDRAPRADPKSENPFPIIGVLVVFYFLMTYIASFLGRTKEVWPGGVIGGLLVLAIGAVALSFVASVVIALFAGLFGLFLDFLLSRNYKIRKDKGLPTGFWHSTGGFSGGGGGSSFGGFGGGSSGGGGASGRW